MMGNAPQTTGLLANLLCNASGMLTVCNDVTINMIVVVIPYLLWYENEIILISHEETQLVNINEVADEPLAGRADDEEKIIDD